VSVLVTGCTGFIGSNLTAKLVENGYSVYGLVRHVARKKLKALDPILDKIRLIDGDLTSYHSVSSALGEAQPQFVLHLGALSPVRLSFENPFPYVATDFEGTVNIVHAMLEKAPKARLVFASTAEVYGWQDKHQPIKETAALNPASPYAVCKEASDQYVRMAMRIYDFKATVLRPINSYGRHGEKGFLVEYLVSKMLKHETCYIGAPKSVRDYMFVDDHVNAYLLALKSEKAVGEVFNVSPDNPVTNEELASILSKVTEFKGKLAFGSYPPGYSSRPIAQDPDYLVLDSSKIRNFLGWKPSVSLEQGLRKTVERWKIASHAGSN
jgi:nucleoside-diphosphate-sugar epimerase